MPRGNADNLRAAAQRKSVETTQRAEAALRAMVKRGERISFRGLARTAGCSEDFLYAQPELRSRIEHLRAQQRSTPPPPEAIDPSATSSVVRTLTAQLVELRRRHHDEVTQLREALAVAQGELLQLRRRSGTEYAFGGRASAEAQPAADHCD